MQRTLVHRRTIAPALVAVAIALSLLLFLMVTVRGTDAPTSARSPSSPAADAAGAATGDSGHVDAWAAGDAAVREALADLGRERFAACR